MRVYSRAMRNESWMSVEDYLQTPTFTAYNNRYGSHMDYRWLAGHWLAEFPSGDGKMVYRDMTGVTPELVPLDFPPPMYLVDDEGTGSGDFHPQALKTVIIVGLIAVGVVAWLAACTLTAMLQADFAEDRLDSGNDKFKHCVAGCLSALCFPLPPVGIGIAWEVGQGISTGWDYDWHIDAMATDMGAIFGGICKSLPAPILFLLGGFQGCCEKSCLATWGTGGVFYGKFH